MSHKRNDKLQFITIKIRRATFEKWERWMVERIQKDGRIISRSNFIDSLEPKQDKEKEN